VIPLLLALAIGVIAGLRAMLAPAAIAWAAKLGWIDLGGNWFAFLGHKWAVWITSVLALAELVTDQLPKTPSRTVPPQFTARIIAGAVCGAAVAAAGNASWIVGLICGIAGAVIGTLGGRAVRAKLASAFGNDHPAAIIEDIVAIAGAIAIMAALR
jgi:uncharacterized membrane protein